MPNPASNSNWMVNSQPWSGSGGNVVGGGGDPFAPTGAAARLDRLRMGEGQLPDASWPDGYLGSVNGRQQGKQDDQLRTRLGDRAYQRGVHKDTKMSPDQYQWPVDFTPESGLQRQAMGRRSGNVVMCPKFVSTGDPAERYNAQVPLSDVEMQQVYARYGVNATTGQATDTIDPARRAVMSRMLPPYSW